MSRWTHVAGIVRIDSLCHIVGGDWVGDLQRLLEECPGPDGSEGGLRYKIVDAPTSEDSASRGYVTIDGDLRDFGALEDIDELLAMLNVQFPILQLSTSWLVRQGIVQVEDEAEENSCHLWYHLEKGWQKLLMNIAG